MERLTQWIDEGKAIPRVDLRRCGHERCTTQLAKYEDTGLTPDEINTLRERDTAKAPEEFDGYWFKCPSCGNYAGGIRGNFCHVCGQRLKWEAVRV